MRSPVISLHAAVRPLLTPQVARVETVFRRAVNLRLESGALVTLLAPELGDGPGALVVAADWPLPWTVGEGVEVSPTELCAADFAVAIDGAALWEPGPPPVLGQLGTVRQGWLAAVGELRATKDRMSPFLSSFCAEGTAALTYREFARRGLSALIRGDWAEAVACLVGLGPGLTPSGDDFLAGFLLLAHRSGWGTAAPLREAIRSLPQGRTTPVSESLLHWATEGVVGERALLWLDGLIAGAPRPIEPVLAIGATSGVDFAAGALLALDLFLKEREA